jgi:fumarate reductase flavoprotein subunit
MWAWPNSGPTYYAIVNQNWLDNIKAKGFAENRVELFCNAGFATFPLNTNIPAMDDVLSACLDAGIAVKADTIQMLAAKLNMNAATLAKTLNDYNDYCKTGVDAAFNKKSNYLVIMDRGPYYAFTAAPRPYSSIGGLDVNSALQVLMADGKTPIKGLYAGGTDCLGATAPAFGGELQLWAYMSGYFAAESAVR